MSIRKSVILFGVALSMAAYMGGCSSDTKDGGSAADVGTVSEAACAQCHSTAVDHIAGTKIYDAYLASAHFTNNFHQVGCQDCHGGGAMHNGVGPLPYPNPDKAGKCFSCHKNYLPKAHYRAYTTNAGTRPAMYVAKNYEAGCTNCHDPHKANNGITAEHRDWAESGHGEVDGLAWSNRDFKTTDMTGACTPCHTSTGFINFVNSGFTMPTVTYAQPGDFSREVLTCAACHTSYDFANKVRNVAAVKAIYTYGGAAITFPNSGASNICIVCHSGRGNMQSAASSRFQGHHAPAAAFLFNTKSHVGYEYAGKNYANSLAFAHDKIGTAAYPATGSMGPCVTCHMVGNAKTHSFAAVTKNASSAITAVNTASVCAGCHGSVSAADLESLRLGYNNAGLLLNDYINNVMKNYSGGTGRVIGAGTAQIEAYAAFQNAKITTEELGGYAHNGTYVKRLIFDSIDWLDNRKLDGTITVPASYPNAREWFNANSVTGAAVRP